MAHLDMAHAGPSDLTRYDLDGTLARRSGALSASALGAQRNWQKNRKFAVVVDAGSSGSRMQVYSWRDPKLEREARRRSGKSVRVLPTVEKGTWDQSEEEWQLKVEPGEQE